MKQDLLYLYNILKSVEIIEEHLKKIDLKKFSCSILIQDAISKRLEEIGENAKKISNSLKEKYPQAEFEEYTDIRNFLTHVYQMLNVNRLWKIIKQDLPELKKQIKRIIEEVKEDEN